MISKSSSGANASPKRVIFIPIKLQPEFAIFEGVPSETRQSIQYTHAHDCMQIGCCYEGSGVLTLGRKVLNYTSGDTLIIPAGEVHFARSTTGREGRWAWVYLDALRLLGAELRDRVAALTAGLVSNSFPNVIAPSRDPFVGAVMTEIIAELKQRPVAHQESVKALVWHLLIRLQRMVPRHTEASPSTPGLRKLAPALDLMAETHAEEASPAKWAGRCHMSVSHFRRLFRVAMGKTPLEYLNELRIGIAASRLRCTDDKIVAISQEVGFTALSSFNRCFRKVMHTTPRAWRSGR